MNRKMVLSAFLVLLLFFSISAIQASDVNITDSIASNSSGDIPLQLEDENQIMDFEHSDLSSDDNHEYLRQDIKNQTVLISQKSNSYGHYTVVLKDSNADEALMNKTVNFVVDGVINVATTDENGVAGVNLGEPGNYAVNVCFEGDDNYLASNLTAAVNVLPSIKASDMSKYYKASKQYSATFFDTDGNYLANRKVTITVNGKSYSKKTDSNGVARMSMDFKPGTYKVVSTNPVTGYQSTNTFKILHTITSSDFKKVVGDSKKFVAKFLKSNGNPLANQKVKFKVNGKTYHVKTNSKGKASLSLNNLKKGTYKVISYNKDGLSKTNTVKLFSIATTKVTVPSGFYTFLPNETKEIKIKFTTSLGDSSNSGKVIKIKVGDKTYSKKTDANGVAVFNFASIKKGLYTVEYRYDGDKFFKSSKTKNMVTILGDATPKLTVKSTTRFGYGAGTLLKVALTADGVPLAKRTMTFTIEGKEYSDTTDNNGIASVPIDLNIGDYTINYKTNTKFKVNGTSRSCKINVFQRSNAKLAWKCGTSYKDSSQTFKVLLTDLNGKPISGQTVELTIDGEVHTGKTKSDGYATIKTEVALGKYNVFVTALGDNDFLPSTTSKSINVKVSKFGGGLNEKNHASSLSAYLKSTKNCPVNNAKIKSLVKSLTSGLTNNIDKAKAIFNYVRDIISYDYYYNSHRGAVGTLNAKSGNCVDQASLLIAMYRTAGFKARYVHGTCKFYDDGRYYGHVWTQVLIDNTWVVGDPINHVNSLGKIKNWNPNTYSLKSRYLSVPF